MAIYKSSELAAGFFVATYSLLHLSCCYGQSDLEPSLVSVPASLTEPVCPNTTVLMTCTARNVRNLKWLTEDGQQFASYEYSPGDTFPRPPTENDFSSRNVVIEITSAVQLSNPEYFNATSTLTTDVATMKMLNISGVICGEKIASTQQLSDLVRVDINLLDPPLPPPISCYLLMSDESKVSLQWSPSFTSQYAVERYRVSVNPDPFSCSSEQVSPSEDYSCSGLVLGTLYTFTVSAINCGNQEGDRKSVNVKPQAPGSPTGISVQPTYNRDSKLVDVGVLWNIESTSQSCHTLNYTVVLLDSTMVVEQQVVTSEDCSDSFCSTSFSVALCSVSYYIRILASNTFGSSNTTDTALICPPRLTAANQGLLAVGVVACVLAVVVTAVYLVLVRKTLRKSKRRLSFVVSDVLVSVVAVVMWIATAIHVGTQKDTVNSPWQSSRDGLIITTFVISVLACVIVILLAALDYLCKKQNDKFDVQREEEELKKQETVFRNLPSEEIRSTPEQSLVLRGGGFGAIRPWWIRNAKECQLCRSKFYRMPGYRHHHCRACGKMVCGACSPNKAYLQYSKKTERVCADCFEESKGYKESKLRGIEEEKSPSPNRIGGTELQKDLKQFPLEEDTDAEDMSEIQNTVPTAAESVEFRCTEPEFESFTNICSCCKINFSKSYQCPVCGMWVCKKCSMKEASVKGKNERICDKCHQLHIEKPEEFSHKEPFDFIEHVPSKCILCNKGFKLPRYCQCLRCGKWVCKKCLKNEAPLEYLGKTEKVCDFCYEEYKLKTRKAKISGGAMASCVQESYCT